MARTRQTTTYCDHTSAAITYRGYRIVPERSEMRYNRGRGRLWMWAVLHPDPRQAGRRLVSTTLEAAKAIVDGIHDGYIAAF